MYILCSFFEFFLERGLRVGVRLKLLKLINGGVLIRCVCVCVWGGGGGGF